MEMMQSDHLALSVISEGKTYQKRLEIMQSDGSKSEKLAKLKTICKQQAKADSSAFSLAWNSETVAQAAVQVYDHMAEDCEE